MTPDPKRFAYLTGLAAEGRGRHLKRVIEKEWLHYDILFCMAEAGLLRHLVFQGGTALRLCYGGHRYSEDLDFAVTKDFDLDGLNGLNAKLEAHIGRQYGLPCRVKPPKRRVLSSGGAAVEVNRWELVVDTDTYRRDLPSQRIKIEVAEVPARTQEVQGLRKNYVHLPDGYAGTLIPVETKEEIMADKLIALPSSHAAGRIRLKDLWDLNWLVEQGCDVDGELVAAKVVDYELADYAGWVEDAINDLPKITESAAFKQGMRAFLDAERFRRTFGNPDFPGYVFRQVREILEVGKAAAIRAEATPARPCET